MIECYSLITILSIIVGGVASLALGTGVVEDHQKRLKNKSRSRVTKTKDIMKQRRNYVTRNQSLRESFRTRFSKEVTRALQDVDFKVDEKEFIAIMGESDQVKQPC